MSLRSSPTFTDLTLVATGSRGIGLLEDVGDTFIPRRDLLEDATLAPRSAAGIPNVPYVLRSQLTVPRLRTLTIAPGTIVKFRSGNLWVEGGLVADAAGAAPIVFTDLQDDAAGGDTNADGNASAPSPGGWNLHLRPTALPTSVLRNVQIRYGNRIYLTEATARIEGSTIEQMAGPLTITGAVTPAIVDNQFLNIGTVPVAVSPFARPAFSGNTVANVPTLALGLLGGTFVSDFTLAPQSFAGYANITYVPFDGGAFNVESGATLTIPAGTVFKFDGGFFSTGLTITGALRTEGTAANPVVLTAIGDDRYGNPADTNQDGATAPGRSAGVVIRLTDATDDAGTVLDGLVLAHAAVGIEMTNASPTIQNSRFEFIESVGIDLLEVSAPTITGNTFADFDRFGVPVRFSLASDFSASGNVLEGQTMEALGIRPETLASDATLPRRSFAGRAGIPYYLAGTYTVGTGATLTVDPGVVVKANGFGVIRVQRGFLAEGGEAPGDKVVFTAITDDFYGGDTNRDSSATGPSAGGGWGGITFENEAIDALSRLDNVVLRYASEAVRAQNAAPSITNTLFQFNRIGLRATGAANPSVTASDFDGHTQWAVLNEGTFSVGATNNYWGDDSGPTAPGNPGGTGEPISGDVAFTPFVGGTVNPALGDVSLNGLVQAFDAAAVLGHLVVPSLSDLQLSVADVSGNGEVMAMDASFILQFVVGLIDAFPAESEARRPSVPSAAGVTVDVGPVTGAVGDTVRVPVSLGGAGADVYALELAVRGVGATVVGLEAGPAAQGAAADAHAEGPEGRIAIATATPFGEGSVAVVVLRLDAVDARLDVERAVVNETVLDAQAVEAEGPPPTDVGLTLVGPSPFRGTTALRADLPEPSAVRIEVVDALGRRVAVLLDADRGAGSHRVTWDARGVSPGLYFARMVVEGAVSTARLVVVR